MRPWKTRVSGIPPWKNRFSEGRSPKKTGQQKTRSHVWPIKNEFVQWVILTIEQARPSLPNVNTKLCVLRKFESLTLT